MKTGRLLKENLRELFVKSDCGEDEAGEAVLQSESEIVVLSLVLTGLVELSVVLLLSVVVVLAALLSWGY